MRVTAQPRFPMTFQREFQRLWSTAFPAASVYGERSFITAEIALFVAVVCFVCRGPQLAGASGRNTLKNTEKSHHRGQHLLAVNYTFTHLCCFFRTFMTLYVKIIYCIYKIIYFIRHLELFK